MKNITKFTNADKSQRMTVVVAQGKKGFNLKASVKTGTGKGQPKAVTGCRETYKTAPEAVKGYEAVVAGVKARGWTEVAVSVKNAFDLKSIPSGAKTSPAPKK